MPLRCSAGQSNAEGITASNARGRGFESRPCRHQWQGSSEVEHVTISSPSLTVLRCVARCSAERTNAEGITAFPGRGAGSNPAPAARWQGSLAVEHDRLFLHSCCPLCVAPLWPGGLHNRLFAGCPLWASGQPAASRCHAARRIWRMPAGLHLENDVLSPLVAITNSYKKDKNHG